MKRIFVAGHKGMVGSAICRELKKKLDVEIVFADRSELDLLNQNQVKSFFERNVFDEVYLAAAKVGGIYANNKYPADFIYQNLLIQINVINSAHESGVKKLMFLGSSCIYPKLSSQPINESELLTGSLEPTNEPYAVAKIAGIKLCESYNRQYGRDYRSIMPTNLYGEGDNFHPKNSHVIPALIRRFHLAKLNGEDEVIAWGTGNALREFLYVEDMAKAAVYLMDLDKSKLQEYITNMETHINVGSGIDCSIKELVETIADVVGFTGNIVFDTTKPDGAPRKLMDVSKLSDLGWKATISLEEGLRKTYSWFLVNEDNIRK